MKHHDNDISTFKIYFIGSANPFFQRMPGMVWQVSLALKALGAESSAAQVAGVEELAVALGAVGSGLLML